MMGSDMEEATQRQIDCARPWPLGVARARQRTTKGAQDMVLTGVTRATAPTSTILALREAVTEEWKT
jgi:hypothetical protein